MKTSHLVALLACCLLPVQVAHAQGGPQPDLNKTLEEWVTYPSVLTYDRPAGQPLGRGLTVTSSSLGDGGLLDPKFGGRGGSTSPAASWSPGPKGTKSYVLLFEDGVAGRNHEGITHWLAFNIPADVTSLPEGISEKAVGLRRPMGTMREGANVDNTVSYTGMGGSPNGNNYHLQIFALDTLLDLPGGATRDDVWAAMNHHVLASGKTVAIFRSPPAPPPADPVAAATQAANAAANTQRALMAPTVITMDRPQGQVKGTLKVTSASLSTYGPSGVIPRKFTGRGASVSPAVNWTAGPKGTRSYAVFFEDGVQNKDKDGLLYWLAFNIPAKTTHLPEGLSSPKGAKTAVAGLKEAANLDGVSGYSGMKSIPGAPPFHYHLQVYALDRMIDLPSGATRDQVRSAMEKHVLARGQTVAFYQPPGPGQANLPPAPTRR